MTRATRRVHRRATAAVSPSDVIMRSPRQIATVSLVAILLFAGTNSSAWGATYYGLSVTRIDPDLYRDEPSRTVIRTRFCFENASSDDAILLWDGPSSRSNKLVFSSGSMCEVASLDE